MKQYKNVNWVNGMKINRDHFIQEQNATIYNQMILLKSLISDYYYGIYGSIREEGLILEKSINNEMCHFFIKKLNGVTQGGAIININTNTSFDIKMPDASNEEINENGYFAGIMIHPFEKVPYGAIAENENPPRYPFVIPRYSGVIVPATLKNDDTELANVLIIDKIIYEDGKFKFDENYLPPSFRMSSTAKMVDIVNNVYSLLKNIQEYIFIINKKVLADSSPVNLAKTTIKILNGIVMPVEQVLTGLKIKKYDIPVVQIVEGVMNVVMQYYNQIRLCSPADKEEYINYLSSWINLSTGEYEAILEKFNSHKYNHNQIYESIKIIYEFLNTHEVLLKKLSELAFIGKKKDTNIFVKEHKSRHNFLLD